MHVEFSFVAIKPLRAEHPVGSGKVVEYQPGDVIPASDWGRAADNLVERGKAAMLAVNVPDEDDLVDGDGVQAVPATEPEPEPALHVTQATKPKRTRKKAT